MNLIKILSINFNPEGSLLENTSELLWKQYLLRRTFLQGIGILKEKDIINDFISGSHPVFDMIPKKDLIFYCSKEITTNKKIYLYDDIETNVTFKKNQIIILSILSYMKQEYDHEFIYNWCTSEYSNKYIIVAYQYDIKLKNCITVCNSLLLSKTEYIYLKNEIDDNITELKQYNKFKNFIRNKLDKIRIQRKK